VGAVSTVEDPTTAPEQLPGELPEPPTEAVGDGRENTSVDLARLGWLATVLACLIAVVILLLNGYDGYAAVTFAVAVSAAINLR
jgi:hypothetical protein